MAFGFPYPRFRTTRSLPLEQEELLAAVKWALEDLGWPYKILGGAEFQARIPTTNWSWHHELKVAIRPGGTKGDPSLCSDEARAVRRNRSRDAHRDIDCRLPVHPNPGTHAADRD